MPLTTRHMEAMHIARTAGAFAREFFAHRHFMAAGHSHASDFADRTFGAIRTVMKTRLAAAFPGDAVVDESVVIANHLTLDRGWIIDPISGRRNFLRGIPFYAVALAYLEEDRCQLGVVYDPEHDELFHVRRTAGAACEHAGTDTRLEVAHCDTLDGALICVAQDERPPESGHLAVHHELQDLGSTVRAMGAPALELAHVAAGRCDGFVGLNVDPHHLCAGALLVEEAGGYTLRPAFAEGARAGTPLIGSAPGIAGPLTDGASLALGHRHAETLPALLTRIH
jgi:myo-inositol-1(or 4)-monophosphatase